MPGFTVGMRRGQLPSLQDGKVARWQDDVFVFDCGKILQLVQLGPAMIYSGGAVTSLRNFLRKN